MQLIKQMDFFSFCKNASISYLLKSDKCASFSNAQQMASPLPLSLFSFSRRLQAMSRFVCFISFPLPLFLYHLSFSSHSESKEFIKRWNIAFLLFIVSIIALEANVLTWSFKRLPWLLKQLFLMSFTNFFLSLYFQMQ